MRNMLGSSHTYLVFICQIVCKHRCGQFDLSQVSAEKPSILRSCGSILHSRLSSDVLMVVCDLPFEFDHESLLSLEKNKNIDVEHLYLRFDNFTIVCIHFSNMQVITM